MCFARPKPSQHALEFSTTPSQNSPSYSKEVVKHPVTHPEFFITDLNLYYLNYFMHTCDKYTSTDMRYEQSEKYETYEVFLDILPKITTYFLFL